MIRLVPLISGIFIILLWLKIPSILLIFPTLVWCVGFVLFCIGEYREYKDRND